METVVFICILYFFSFGSQLMTHLWEGGSLLSLPHLEGVHGVPGPRPDQRIAGLISHQAQLDV